MNPDFALASTEVLVDGIAQYRRNGALGQFGEIVSGLTCLAYERYFRGDLIKYAGALCQEIGSPP